MSVQLEISGLEDVGLIRRLMINLVPGLKNQIIRQLSTELLTHAQTEADTHTKTGALVRSIRMQKQGEGYRIQADPTVAPHALFVHWGTRPHEIKPRRKRALRWPSGNRFVFAQRVNHPGYAGDPFLETARARVSADFNRIAREAFAENWRNLTS